MQPAGSDSSGSIDLDLAANAEPSESLLQADAEQQLEELELEVQAGTPLGASMRQSVRRLTQTLASKDQEHQMARVSSPSMRAHATVHACSSA
jgi:hypothetical protein